MDRAQLEQAVLAKLGSTETVPSSASGREELERMVLEKLSANEQTPINREDEASLGIINRARYAVEPIQSNRKALLLQEYGEDNVMEDNKGDLYVKEGGQFRPVDKEGISAANFADIAGATPEILGNIGGGIVGGIPGAMVAGGAGSAARQGISALIGNPQVATAGERAIETGVSSLLSGAGQAVNQFAKPYIQGAKKGITEIIKNLSTPVGEALETTSETVGKSTFKGGLEFVPEYAAKTEKSILSKIVDESGRDAVNLEKQALEGIAERQGLPKPTYAQTAQGKAIIAESELLDTPLISGGVRKIVDKQLKGIKDNLEKVTGKFIDVDSNAFEIGKSAIDIADTGIQATKKVAQELYNQVEEDGLEATIGKRTFFDKFKLAAADNGLIDPTGNPTKYTTESGLTRSEFSALQETIFDGIDAIKSNPSAKIRFQSVNALRKTLNSRVEELADSSPNAARILKKFANEIDETTHNVLRREAPELAEKFGEANRNWRTYKQHQEKFQKLFKKDGSLDGEKVVKTIMSGTTNVSMAKEILGEQRVKELGVSYLRDKLGALGKSGIGRADSVLTDLKKPSVAAPLKEAIGEDAYKNVIENLHFLNRTGQPLHVSRQSLLKLISDQGVMDGISKIGGRIAGAGKNYAVSKGGAKAVKEATVETTSRVVGEGGKNLPSIFNLGTDEMQRSYSAVQSSQKSAIAEQQKEIERRKRAISGVTK